MRIEFHIIIMAISAQLSAKARLSWQFCVDARSSGISIGLALQVDYYYAAAADWLKQSDKLYCYGGKSKF